MIVSRSWTACFGLMLAACGGQPQSQAAVANDGDVAAAAAPATTNAASDAEPVNAITPVADEQEYTEDRTNQTTAGVLRKVFLKVGTIDGKPITGLELHDRCDMVFTTPDGTATINWRKVGNFAGRDDGERWSVDIDDGTSTHAISVPVGPVPEIPGNVSALVDSGFGSMTHGCES